MSYSSLQCDVSTEGIAGQVNFPQLQVRDQRGYIIGQCFKAVRTIDVGGVSMSLQMHRNHLTGLRQSLDIRAKAFESGDSAVQQNQRLTLAINLVVDLHAMNRCVSSFTFCVPGNSCRANFSASETQDQHRYECQNVISHSLLQ